MKKDNATPENKQTNPMEPITEDLQRNNLQAADGKGVGIHDRSGECLIVAAWNSYRWLPR